MDIKTIPKLELHCHLDGSLPLETVRALTGRKEITLSDLQAEPDCRSLKEYLEKFDIPLSAMQTREGLYAAARDFIHSLEGDGVRYVEVRFAPMQSVHPGLSCGQVLESVLEGLLQARRETGIDSRVIVCTMRHHPQEKNLEMMRTARNYLGQGVCALDLAGDEAAYPLKEFRQLFAEAKKTGVSLYHPRRRVPKPGECTGGGGAWSGQNRPWHRAEQRSGAYGDGGAAGYWSGTLSHQ